MTDANSTPGQGPTDPTVDPITDPTASPITDPTADPTVNPTAQPMADPEADTTPVTPVPTTRTAAPETAALPKRRPLFPTILWGVLMLALAAFIAARELVPGGLDLVTWLLTAVVGIGLLLVVAGIAAASRRAG